MSDRLLSVSTFRHAQDNEPKGWSLSWDDLSQLLTEHRERERKDGLLWSPNCYPADTTRGWESVESMCCLVADIDKGADYYTVDVIEQMLDGYAYAIHSTHSHSDEVYKFRVIVPLDEDVPASEWGKVWDRWQVTFAHLRIKLDSSCKDASRIYYLPSCVPGAPRFSLVQDGKHFDLGFMPEVDYSARSKVSNDPAYYTAHPGAGATADTLLSRALQQAKGQGNRNENGLWLACQLRDNGYDEASAEGILRQYVDTVQTAGGHPYRLNEALSSVKSAFKRQSRTPWGSGRLHESAA